MSDSSTIADLLEHRGHSSHISRPERQPATADAADEYVAFGHGRIGRRPQMMLAVIPCSGDVEVFAYSSLTRISSRNRDTAFTLRFGTIKVTVEGENLLALFRYLCDQRVAEIVEADRSVLMEGNDDAVVSRILIGTGED